MRGLILVGAVLLPVVASAQGLGDAAAREKLKRQNQPAKPQRAITQEQLDAAAAGKDAWVAPDGSFRVAFGRQPEVKDESARGAGVSYRLAVGSTAYVVNVKSQEASADATALIDQIRNKAISGVLYGSLKGENSVNTPKGIPGRQFLISFSARTSERPGMMRTRAYILGGRSFVVTVVVEAGNENAPEVVAFLDSFEILK